MDTLALLKTQLAISAGLHLLAPWYLASPLDWERRPEALRAGQWGSESSHRPGPRRGAAALSQHDCGH